MVDERVVSPGERSGAERDGGETSCMLIFYVLRVKSCDC